MQEFFCFSPDTTDKLLNGTFDLPGKLKFNSNPSTPDNRSTNHVKLCKIRRIEVGDSIFNT